MKNSMSVRYNPVLAGSLLAVAATVIWSGNYVIARGIGSRVPPVALACLRWTCAFLVMLPLAWKAVLNDLAAIRRHAGLLLLAALVGVSLFNTLIYVAGHYTAAVNLALIGTTSSAVFSFILARLVLGEKIPLLRITGLICCLAGVVVLMSKGNPQAILQLQFTHGDWWMLGAALMFSLYNILTRKKPETISGSSYLLVTFGAGALMLFPAAMLEQMHHPAIRWSTDLALIILYLGAGASVLAYFFWNRALALLGTARTAIYGNLIPVFSGLEAWWLLGEKIAGYHLLGMAIVAAGLIMANMRPSVSNT